MYTTLVPERPTLPVDFVSGDYLGNAAISRARLEARYLSCSGEPWDLMAWGFQSGRSNPVGPIHKSSVQLKQEAAVVLAQGGGFQIYYQPTRAGKVDDRHIDVMAKVAKFCRARQQFCHQSETVPEIGVLFSGGIDSGSVFLVLYHLLLERGESPARLKAFTLSIDGGMDWVRRKAAGRTKMSLFTENSRCRAPVPENGLNFRLI